MLGAEIRKTRPALILRNDVANHHSPLTIVAAISSKFDDPLYPTEVLIARPEGGLNVDSVVLLNQIRSMDRRRLTKRLGAVRPSTMAKVSWHPTVGRDRSGAASGTNVLDLPRYGPTESGKHLWHQWKQVRHPVGTSQHQDNVEGNRRQVPLALKLLVHGHECPDRAGSALEEV